MALPIITADQRLAEARGVKGCIFGKSGIGKTSLLWTLDPKTTLFLDLEAGDLAIEGWTGDALPTLTARRSRLKSPILNRSRSWRLRSSTTPRARRC